MSNWSNLHSEILVNIYQYLSPRDRLACSLVNHHWQNSLNHPSLWKRISIRIDDDFTDPSTILLIRYYNRYLKNLEFGWALPYHYHLPQLNRLYITKKAVRFLMILHDNFVQIEHLKLFNWQNNFNKIYYHLSRFLNIQLHLKKISLHNINLISKGFIKILPSCVSSKETITCLDLSTDSSFRNATNFVHFRSFIEQMINLRTLRLDYLILSSNIIDALLISKSKYLEILKVDIKNSPRRGQIIDNQQWIKLIEAYPNIKVFFIMRNPVQSQDMSAFLTSAIPLVSFSIVSRKRINFRCILTLLIDYYYETLVNVDICVKINNQYLDDLLIRLFKTCKNLETVSFNGILRNPKILKICFPDLICNGNLNDESPSGTMVQFNLITNVATLIVLN